MKKTQGLILFMLVLLAACGQTDPTGENHTQAGSPGESYEMLVESCPELVDKGQTFNDLSKEEQQLYDVTRMKDTHAVDSDFIQVAMLQSKRKGVFTEVLDEEGYTLRNVKDIGDFHFMKGTIVLQFKDSLTEQEQKVKSSILKAAEEVKKTFNEEAVKIEGVSLAANDLATHSEALSKTLEGSTIEDKLWGYGTCSPAKLLKVEVTEPLTKEEKKLLNDHTEVEIAVQVSAPNELEGYVTALKEGKMLVNMIWFSNRPEEVEVGDHVRVSYTNVMESLPAQSGAKETAFIKDVHPEGANKTSSEVIKESVEQAEQEMEEPTHSPSYVSVKQIDFRKEEGRWVVLFETTLDEDTMEISVKDE